jgi:hypothetical protein
VAPLTPMPINILKQQQNEKKTNLIFRLLELHFNFYAAFINFGPGSLLIL